jgi:2-polyprenyl-3-methyl-5-hydroxy-6-metoxy-1,4-benzoquinol methylase
MQNKNVFTSYYKNNTWRGKESKSGPGSDYDNTKFLIKELPFIFEKYGIKSILDIPCGDFNWMKRINLDSITYHGADIVDELIEENKAQYKRNNIKFSVLDLINDKLPRVDLVLVRDCFVHLNNDDIKKCLTNIKNSESKYLLSTTFTWIHMPTNVNIKNGNWRRVNLENKPFELPKALTNVVEGEPLLHRDKSLGLWFIKDIPDY